MNKLRKPIKHNGLKEELGFEETSFENLLNDAALKDRWKAMCQFVNKAAEYGVDDDILTCKKHQNLQTKFFFNKDNELTEVSYRNKIERDWGKKIDKYEDEKVIDLTQKQANQETITEMTK